jgi:hypothetical protein
VDGAYKEMQRRQNPPPAPRPPRHPQSERLVAWLKQVTDTLNIIKHADGGIEALLADRGKWDWNEVQNYILPMLSAVAEAVVSFREAIKDASPEDGETNGTADPALPDAKPIKGAIKGLRDLQREMKRWMPLYAPHLNPNNVNYWLGRFIAVLERATPHARCPGCEGKRGPNCLACHGANWVSKDTWEAFQNRDKKKGS